MLIFYLGIWGCVIYHFHIKSDHVYIKISKRIRISSTGNEFSFCLRKNLLRSGWQWVFPRGNFFLFSSPLFAFLFTNTFWISPTRYFHIWKRMNVSCCHQTWLLVKCSLQYFFPFFRSQRRKRTHCHTQGCMKNERFLPFLSGIYKCPTCSIWLLFWLRCIKGL